MPIHRLDEEPTERGILADITCDSDGKIDQFIDLRDVRDTLPLHPFTPDQPYYLGIMLTGAYQEILGDLHNLFGDSNAVHVRVSSDGSYDLSHVVEGDRVSEVRRSSSARRRSDSTSRSSATSETSSSGPTR